MMTLRTRIGVFALVIGACLASVAWGDEKVDNPMYKHWAQFKPGSFATLKAQTTTMGVKSETTATTTLKELTADKAVIETKAVSEAAGQKVELPVIKNEIPAKISAEEAKMQIEPPKGKQKDGSEVVDVQKGKEEIEVMGKKVKTEWTEVKSKVEGQLITAKTWTCEDVPSKVVKVVTKLEGPMASITEVALADFKASKTDKADAGDKKDKDEKKDPGDKKESKDEKKEKK